MVCENANKIDESNEFQQHLTIKFVQRGLFRQCLSAFYIFLLSIIEEQRFLQFVFLFGFQNSWPNILAYQGKSINKGSDVLSPVSIQTKKRMKYRFVILLAFFVIQVGCYFSNLVTIILPF